MMMLMTDVGFYAQCTKMSEDQFQRKRVKAQFLVNYFFRFLKKLNRCTKTFEFDVFKKNLPEAHMLG